MTKSSAARAIRPKPSIAARIPSFLFWGASTALTGSGVFFSLRPAFAHPALALVIALVATSALTLGGFNLFHHAGFQKGKPDKPGAMMSGYVDIDVVPRFRLLALAAGFAVIAVSSWFSFSSMVFMRFGAELQRAMNEEVQAPLIAPIGALEASFARIEADARHLADVASRRSDVEARSGGQCVASGPGAGPIAAMIAAHAAETGAVATEAAVLRTRAGAALTAIRSAKTQTDVASAYRSAQAVLGDPARLSIAATASELLSGYNGAGFVEEGRLITCPRGAPAMVPALDRLVTSANAEVSLPATPPVFREATLVDSAMWQLRAAFSFGHGGIPGVGRWYLFVFGAVALVLDLSGAATAHLAGRLRGANLSDREYDQLATTSTIMENFIWHTPARYKRDATGKVVETQFNSVLVVPTEENTATNKEIIAALHRFASAYNLKPDVARAARSLSELPAEMDYLRRRMRRRGFEGDWVDLYTGKTQDWTQIEAHNRELRLIFGRSAFIQTQRFDITAQSDNVARLRSQA